MNENNRGHFSDVPVATSDTPVVKARTITLNFRLPKLLTWILRNPNAKYRLTKDRRVRFGAVIVVISLLFMELIPLFQPQLASKAYAYEDANSLLPDVNPALGSLLVEDPQAQAFAFNANYNPFAANPNGISNTGGALISAIASIDGSKGVQVTDPINKIDFTLKPKFAVLPGKKDVNRIIYPLADRSGWLVYTMQARGVKEDIILNYSPGDKVDYKYELSLGDAFAAKLEANGDIGIYGSNMPINGQVSTSSEQDAKLLAKVRQKAPKTALLFTLPAPFVVTKDDSKNKVKSAYKLNGKNLTIAVSGLDAATYPLSIDPSVYVKSAQKLMRGNNETNVDFDVTNNQILKGSLTGARIPNWSTGPNALPVNIWNAGVVVAGGYIYVIGGSDGTSDLSTVYWAQFDTTLVDTNANYRSIGTWNTNAGYNLPNARIGMSAVAYNGYIFAMGGQGSDCSSGATAGSTTVCNTVYTSKLGANGEPNTWVQQGNLATERRYATASAFENRMYLYGGQDGSSGFTGSVATSEYAEINPDGSLGTWASTGVASQLPTARYGLSGGVYNGYVYALGGRTSGGNVATVEYAKITPSGLDAWQTTNSFSTGRLTFGGQLSTILNGYMYLSGGCTTVDANGNCTAIATDSQVASINSDGSLSTWTTQRVVNNITPTNLTLSRYGSGLVAWRGGVYSVGGCNGIMTANNCPAAAVQSSNSWGVVTKDGFVGPSQTGAGVSTSLPAAGGGLATATVINNGYIYSAGGCTITSGACTSASGNIYYMPIASDGSIGGTWTATTKGIGQTTGAAVGLAAMGITVFNNRMFIVAGLTSGGNATASTYSAPIDANGNITINWTTTTGTSSVPAAAVLSPFVFSRSNPANPTQGYIYSIGGCTGSASSIGCSGYSTAVRRCTITTAGITAATCAAQAMTLPTTGIGIFGGAVYGNYVYVAGGANGAGAGQTDTVYYAEINSAGVLVNPNTNTTGGGWRLTTGTLTQVRRRTAAFAINGYLYVLAGHDGSGTQETLSDMQVGKINTETGDIAFFEDNANHPKSAYIPYAITARWNFSGAAANGNIYVMGGCSNGNPPNTCGTNGVDRVTQYIQVYNNYSGSPAQYTTTNNPTTTRIGASSVINNGYIYQGGGCSDIACTTVVNTVEAAPINADGTLGTWFTTGVSAMGTARTFFKLAANNGYLYAVGGKSGAAATTALSTTERTTFGVNGTLPAWTPDTTLGSAAGSTAAVVANSRSSLDTVIYNGYIYAAGGHNQANANQTTIYYALLNTSTGAIGTWATTTNTFLTGRSGLSIVAYNATMYVLGGFDGTNYLPDVQYAKITNAGNINTAFVTTANMPQPISDAEAYAANGFLYVIGGRSAATTCTNNTYVNNILANSTIANGNNPNGIGNWSQTSVVYGTAASSARYGASVSYSSGKVYILGGGCAAMVGATPTDRAYYSTIQAQPQIAKYGYVIDADTDVFPSKTLFNGLDNGIGASWVLNYRSSTRAAASWGRDTAYGKTTLGTPQPYIPVDAAGTNTNFSQYHYILLTIDVSEAFGFPEDVSRGPTITDLTFQFTSDPSKRLRNGKTFIGGEQQPLDTPF